MDRHLFDRINICRQNTHLPNGMVADYRAEANRYEELIEKAGGIDLQILGIGHSGHIGFNEPLSALFSRTREKALTQTTVDQNAPLFDSPNQMPRRAFTMGIGTILDARRIVLLATGTEKADILAKAVEGPVTAMISATALQLHPATTVVVDEDAASRLAGKIQTIVQKVGGKEFGHTGGVAKHLLNGYPHRSGSQHCGGHAGTNDGQIDTVKGDPENFSHHAILITLFRSKGKEKMPGPDHLFA
jgi:hypothetical protein